VPKCLHCGKVFETEDSIYSHYCCDDCYIMGISSVYHNSCSTSLKVRCNTMMAGLRILCRLCVHRVEKVVSDKCNRMFRKVKE